jgi:hypothetical protein
MERHNVIIFSVLRKMGLKNIPRDSMTAIHYSALGPLRKYNPNLKFRGRSVDQLLSELDNSIKHIIRTWKWQKYSGFIYALMAVLFFIVLSMILIALRQL